MKLSKVITAAAIAICLVFQCSIPALASDNSTGKHVPMSYVILDEDGTIVEQGDIPLVMPVYSWSGVTVLNGQTAQFRPTHDYRGLYAVKGTKISCNYSLARNAKHRSLLAGHGYGIIGQREFTGDRHAFYPTAPASDYYYLSITNLSSDSLTVRNVTITF